MMGRKKDSRRVWGRRIAVPAAAVLAVVVLPLAGVVLSGRPVGPYLEFPPVTRHVSHAPFSGFAFVAMALLILLGLFMAARVAFRCTNREVKPPSTLRGFPWWGWFSLAANAFSWVIAWSRFDWAREFQPHTFTPLWITYIVFVNALCVKRYGTSLMTQRPAAFLCLFPCSAAFWWLFEYLNRFVQNWHYSAVEALGAWEYFARATVCFSTVLPAVISTQLFFYNSTFVKRCCSAARQIRPERPRTAATAVLGASVLILFFLGRASDYLFPFLWVAPLGILAGLQALAGSRHVFVGVLNGDWRGPVSGAVSALCCGWFWEMWNFYSLSKWHYTIPFVEILKVFEMPLLGWAGYIPFGVECAAAAGLLGIRTEDLQVKESS